MIERDLVTLLVNLRLNLQEIIISLPDTFH